MPALAEGINFTSAAATVNDNFVEVYALAYIFYVNSTVHITYNLQAVFVSRYIQNSLMVMLDRFC